MSVGIDFGTTNSVLAVAPGRGGIQVARHGADRSSSNFRSILCFVRGGGAARAQPIVLAGPAAMEAYLEHGSDCRLIQSVKSMVANPNFSQTHIFGRKFTIEELVAEILNALRASAEAELPPLGDSVTAGRPVRFAGQLANEELALKRLADAFGLAGFRHVDFAAEPLAAAYKFASGIRETKLCVVADFGGGTSDFSLVRLAPGAELETLGASGVGIAGDRLDYRIIEKIVCPLLGLDSHYLSMGKRLPMPVHYYSRFQRWSDLSFLRAPDTLRELRGLMRMSEVPEALERLIYIIEEELGFDLYRAVSAAKTALSSQETATLEFRHGPVQISEQIRRDDFNRWIAEDLDAIDAQLSKLFEGTGAGPADVDQVFMTGGTSFVPAIRALVAARFHAADFADGDEFISVGAGLALYGRERSNGGLSV
ncbi:MULTISPECIES: Hsp70 family protein [Rhodomicrobium]|uniref:Hsp70 family protein n=1 Tax=Rhodomicrobium TaxID=1068 RepID=UPI0014838A83|nr:MULTISPECIES: Hsp70 family protein [Rhodomicrobium]